MKIKVIGGGIAGLAAAWYLQKMGEVILYEKSQRVGGWIQSVHQDGFCFEKGPRGFRPAGNGKYTLELCKELGLDLIAANPAAKRRYICHNKQLEEVSFKKLASGMWRDLIARKPKSDDETLETFFNRHLGKKRTAYYVDPFARGIFGGDYRKLSARSCFPKLWNERSFLMMKKEKKPETSLYSFKEGMESLPKALGNRLNIILGHEVNEVEGDIVIWATPQVQSKATLSTVSMGWHDLDLGKKGYGFLVPQSEPEPFYGMTWDSQIFPEQAGKSRVCVMIGSDASDEHLLTTAMDALRKYLQIDVKPDSVCIGRAVNAIAQYELGHHKWVEQVESSLPSGHYVIGSSFRGVGINDCVADARRVASLLGAL